MTAMPGLQKFVDIHPHTSFKYTYNDNNDLWDSMDYRRTILERIIGIAAYSQSDFRRMALGGVEIAFVSLHAIEQKMNFLTGLAGGVLSDPIERAAQFLTKIPKEAIEYMRTKEYDHFTQILLEKEMLHLSQNRERRLRVGGVNRRKCRYKLVKDLNDVKEILRENESNGKQFTIAVVLTIEGIYNLGAGHIPFNGSNNFNVPISKMLNRIDNLKGMDNEEGNGWICTPIWTSLAHIFSNGYFGFAQPLKKSFKGIFEYAESPGDPGAEINTGITDDGKKIIKRLLGIDGQESTNERRIHVDIKHLSSLARKQYYELIDLHNASHPEDIIPVVISHGAVNGKPDLNEQSYNPLDSDSEQENSEGFNPWSINIYDEEIKRIHDTNGLFGIMLDERILSGKKKVKDMKTKGVKKWGRIFMDQIEYIVKLAYDQGFYNKEQIWRRLSIGTDFDGQINATNAFDTSRRLPRLRKRIEKELADSRFDQYRSGKTPQQLADFICYENAFHFLEKQFK